MTNRTFQIFLQYLTSPTTCPILNVRPNNSLSNMRTSIFHSFSNTNHLIFHYTLKNIIKKAKENITIKKGAAEGSASTPRWGAASTPSPPEGAVWGVESTPTWRGFLRCLGVEVPPTPPLRERPPDPQGHPVSKGKGQRLALHEGCRHFLSSFLSFIAFLFLFLFFGNFHGNFKWFVLEY